MDDLARAVIVECRRRLVDESGGRLRRCLELCPEDQLWWRGDDRLASIGNLTLHLCGNIRQWLLAGLGGAGDERDRDAEFERREGLSGAELRARWDAVIAESAALLERLDPSELLRVRPVQAFRESGLAILVHVVEHASYHVGQITWITRYRSGADTGWYAGTDLARRDGG